MPRSQGRGKRSRAAHTRQFNYNEDSEEGSDTSFDGDGLEMLSAVTTFLSFFSSGRRSRGRRSAARTPKRRLESGNCENCEACKKKRKRSAPRRKAVGKNTNLHSAAASTSHSGDVILDSDEETKTAVTESHVKNINTKVGNFFQALESDEEIEIKKKPSTMPAELKTKDFYTVLSDSDEDVLSTSIFSNKETVTDTEPSISLLPPVVPLNDSQQNLDVKSDSDLKECSKGNKIDDFLAYVDDVLNECNEVIDITGENAAKAPVMMSLEELKKQTDEILNDVRACAESLQPKPKEPETKSTPVKEAPICPICLEALGGSRQAMATLCGHMFCEPCIKQVIQSTKKCPSCRKGLTKTKYHPVYL